MKEEYREEFIRLTNKLKSEGLTFKSIALSIGMAEHKIKNIRGRGKHYVPMGTIEKLKEKYPQLEEKENTQNLSETELLRRENALLKEQVEMHRKLGDIDKKMKDFEERLNKELERKLNQGKENIKKELAADLDKKLLEQFKLMAMQSLKGIRAKNDELRMNLEQKRRIDNKSK